MHENPPQTKIARSRLLGLSVLAAAALLLRVGVAEGLKNFLISDEVFQTLEPAHRLAFGYGAVTWEWREGIRSWVFPAFLAGVMRATQWMGPGSAGYLVAVAVVLSILSLSTVWFGWAWARRASGEAAGMLAAGACAVYFGLVFLAPKALSEGIATYLLLPGLYLGVYGESLKEGRRLFLAGLLCGFAAMLRIQLIPSVLYALAMFCLPDWRRRLLPVAGGTLIPVFVFGLVDWLTWGHPWQSIVGNVSSNLVAGRAAFYGVDPWYSYLLVLLGLLFPAFIFFPLGSKRSPFLAVFSLIFIAAHSLIAHKEPRFMLPIIPLLLTLGAMGVVEALSHAGKRPVSRQAIIWAGVLVFLLPSVLMGAAYAWLFRSPGTPMALDRLSTDAEVCGVGLYGLPWWSSGGYAHLHRNVPIVPVTGANELALETPEFNALITPRGTAPLPPDFTQDRCWGGACLDRRAGVCTAAPAADQLNGFLRVNGK